VHCLHYPAWNQEAETRCWRCRDYRRRLFYASKLAAAATLGDSADRAAGKKTGNRSANILMKLRQAAIHPLLYWRHYTDNILSCMAKACLKEEQWSQSNPDIIFEELQAYNSFRL
jgi:hypothetical protein